MMRKAWCPPALAEKTHGDALPLDVAFYQQPDAVASIRRGLAQAREGVGRPADEVFDELERENA